VVPWTAYPRFNNMIFTPFMSLVNSLTFNIMIVWIILSCRMVLTFTVGIQITVICNNNKSMYRSDQIFVRILFCTRFVYPAWFTSTLNKLSNLFSSIIRVCAPCWQSATTDNGILSGFLQNGIKLYFPFTILSHLRRRCYV